MLHRTIQCHFIGAVLPSFFLSSLLSLFVPIFFTYKTAADAATIEPAAAAAAVVAATAADRTGVPVCSRSATVLWRSLLTIRIAVVAAAAAAAHTTPELDAAAAGSIAESATALAAAHCNRRN